MKRQFDLYPTPGAVAVSASPRMIATLKKCYQVELTFPGKPYGPKDLKESFSGLYKRGLLDVDTSNKSLKTGRWYITNSGLLFLISISAKRLPVSDKYLIHNINRMKDNLNELQNSIHKLKVTSGRLGKQIA